MYRCSSALRMLLAGLALAGTAAAQQTSIQGVVTDPSGALVPGAEIVVTNPGTSVSLRAPTNDQGYYAIPFLTPGTYTIKVSKTGFSTVTRESVKLDVGQAARADFTVRARRRPADR